MQIETQQQVIEYFRQRLAEVQMTLILFAPARERLNKLIEAGHGFADFKLVIDYKMKKWAGTEYQKYIRPETLFGKNFETYLHESRNATTIQRLANSIQSAKQLIDRSVVKLRRGT
jgi:uncharacterized phage protein (TIGR02220 family)